MRAQERKQVFVSFLPHIHSAASQCRSQVKEQCPTFFLIKHNQGKSERGHQYVMLFGSAEGFYGSFSFFIYWGNLVIKESLCSEILLGNRAFVLVWERKPLRLAPCMCLCTSMPLFFYVHRCGSWPRQGVVSVGGGLISPSSLMTVEQ